MSRFAESHVEEATFEWSGGLGCDALHCLDTSPGGPQPEHVSYGEVILLGRLRRLQSDGQRDGDCP